MKPGQHVLVAQTIEYQGRTISLNLLLIKHKFILLSQFLLYLPVKKIKLDFFLPMKTDYLKNILMVSGLMISFLSCNAQIQDNSGILFKETVYQLGAVKEGSNTLCVFSFVNKTKAALVISDVKTYCGCVKLTWTKEPVKPGDSGKIKVNFYAENAGTFSKTIKVFTNINKQSIDLAIKGSVSAKSGRE